jgi:glycosyltransferase involved in cell wall biosynthesis
MQKSNLPIVYLVGTSTHTHGGIGHVIAAQLASRLKDRFNLIHIVTHQDGSSWQKAWVFAKGLMQFLLLKTVHGGKLVHIHSSGGPSFLRKAVFFLLSKVLGCHVILQIHSGGFAEYYEGCGNPLKALIRYMIQASDHVIALTESWKRILGKLTTDESNISVVGNPIDTSKYRPVDIKMGNRPRLLFLGALIKSKGVYDIVESVRRLKAKGLEVEVTLAGDRELDQVREHSQRAGVEQLINLPGWVSEQTKIQLLRTSDVLLLPSYKEGLPLCALEAMACGLPVICSNAGGLVDLVVGGENGLVFVPGDVETMTNHIAALARDADLRQRMGIRNVQKIQEVYSLSVIAGKIGELYEQILLRPQCCPSPAESV